MAGETGREWKVYYNTGTYSTPTWTQIAERKDIDIQMSKERIESRRDGAEWVEMLKGFKVGTFSFPVQYRNANTNFVALKDDFFADDSDYFDLLILDGPQGTSGSQGIRAIVALFEMPINASLGTDESVASLTFEPTYAEESGTPIETDWFTVP